jgi:phenylalanyl-tRNA synthetase beta chain
MKAPLEWINEMTDINVSAHEFADKMTLSGSKVEGIIDPGQGLRKIVVGEVVSVTSHPDSDHLHICSVNTGSEELQIVCGAPNVIEGMKCPVATIGAILPGGFEIKKAKLRGVESFGMCCSAQELGMDPKDYAGATTDGLWSLPQDATVGIELSTYLGLDAAVIDFEITSNRADCFSIEGLAREAAVTFSIPFKKVSPSVIENGVLESSSIARIEIKSPDLCFRYCSRIIENVVIAPSPQWMQNRLRAAGVRPINNIVDITNYVCIELGQPMHAFDLEYLAGNHIIVRTAEENETTVTLDGIERQLDPSMLVIADEEKVCAIAGVMGSENSEVKENTRSILFESATFHPISVRKTALNSGLRTEASLRYEKGLDPENALRALNRACELVDILKCGQISKGIIDVYPTKPETKQIVFEPEKINELLGTDISATFMKETLVSLGGSFSEESGKILYMVPTFRQDLACMADLAEEVARFFDYNNIAPTLLSGKQTTLGGRSREQLIIEKVKDSLVSQGLFEAITYSFESPKESDRLLLGEDDSLRNQVIISNPIGEDFSVMRTSMVPSMLRIASRNVRRSVAKAGIFEIAFVYLPLADAALLPDEKQTLSIILFDVNEDYDAAGLFFRMKGIISSMFSLLGIEDYEYRNATGISYIHPGRAADIIISDKVCGHFGYVHPDVASNFESPNSSVILDLQMKPVVDAASERRTYTALPKYPGVSRDLALTVGRDVSVGSIEKLIKKHGGEYLESCALFDVYQGQQIDKDMKSVAFSLFFRSAERTLNELDIKDALSGIVSHLNDDLHARLR